MVTRGRARKLQSDEPVLTMLSIGTWDWDLQADNVRGDAILARMFGHDADELARGMPMHRFTAKFHPDDLEAGQNRRARVREEGNLFVWEHRVIPAAGIVRWVLARGQLERDANGQVTRGRGICIDMTDSRMEGDVEGQIHLTSGDEGPQSALDLVVDQALGLWDLLDGLDPTSVARLRPKLRILLEEIGRIVASEAMTDAAATVLERGDLH